MTRKQPPCHYARGPAEALEYVQRYRDEIRRHYSQWTTDPRIPRFWTNLGQTDDDVLKMMIPIVRAQTHVYYWRRDLVDLVAQAAASYPLREDEVVAFDQETETPAAPPSFWPRIPHAFCLFDGPTSLRVPDSQWDEFPLQGVLWSVGVMGTTCALTLHGLLWWMDRNTYVVAPGFASFGSGRNEATPMGDMPERQYTTKDQLTRWACAASMFLEQDILRADPATIHASTLKHYERALGSEPAVHVVRLRREVVAQDDDTSASPGSVDWQCRWIVRGHWRKQWFPTRDAHVPVWIHPYVKGPEDKPMRATKPTVYSVQR